MPDGGAEVRERQVREGETRRRRKVVKMDNEAINLTRQDDSSSNDVEMAESQESPDSSDPLQRPQAITTSALTTTTTAASMPSSSSSSTIDSTSALYFPRYSSPTLTKVPPKDISIDPTLAQPASTGAIQRSSYPNSQLPGRASALLNLHGQSPLRDQLQPFRTKSRKLSPLNPLAREESDTERERSASRLSVDSTPGSDGGNSAPSSAGLPPAMSGIGQSQPARKRTSGEVKDTMVGPPASGGTSFMPPPVAGASSTGISMFMHPAHVSSNQNNPPIQPPFQESLNQLPSPGLISPPPLVSPMHGLVQPPMPMPLPPSQVPPPPPRTTSRVHSMHSQLSVTTSSSTSSMLSLPLDSPASSTRSLSPPRQSSSASNLQKGPQPPVSPQTTAHHSSPSLYETPEPSSPQSQKSPKQEHHHTFASALKMFPASLLQKSTTVNKEEKRGIFGWRLGWRQGQGRHKQEIPSPPQPSAGPSSSNTPPHVKVLKESVSTSDLKLEQPPKLYRAVPDTSLLQMQLQSMTSDPTSPPPPPVPQQPQAPFSGKGAQPVESLISPRSNSVSTSAFRFRKASGGLATKGRKPARIQTSRFLSRAPRGNSVPLSSPASANRTLHKSKFKGLNRHSAHSPLSGGSSRPSTLSSESARVESGPASAVIKDKRASGSTESAVEGILHTAFLSTSLPDLRYMSAQHAQLPKTSDQGNESDMEGVRHHGEYHQDEKTPVKLGTDMDQQMQDQVFHARLVKCVRWKLQPTSGWIDWIDELRMITEGRESAKAVKHTSEVSLESGISSSSKDSSRGLSPRKDQKRPVSSNEGSARDSTEVLFGSQESKRLSESSSRRSINTHRQSFKGRPPEYQSTSTISSADDVKRSNADHPQSARTSASQEGMSPFQQDPQPHPHAVPPQHQTSKKGVSRRRSSSSTQSKVSHITLLRETSRDPGGAVQYAFSYSQALPYRLEGFTDKLKRSKRICDASMKEIVQGLTMYVEEHQDKALAQFLWRRTQHPPVGYGGDAEKGRRRSSGRLSSDLDESLDGIASRRSSSKSGKDDRERRWKERASADVSGLRSSDEASQRHQRSTRRSRKSNRIRALSQSSNAGAPEAVQELSRSHRSSPQVSLPADAKEMALQWSPFAGALTDLVAIALQILDRPVPDPPNQLLGPTHVEFMSRIQNLYKLWMENPDWPCKTFIVKLVLAFSPVNRLLETMEAGKRWKLELGGKKKAGKDALLSAVPGTNSPSAALSLLSQQDGIAQALQSEARDSSRNALEGFRSFRVDDSNPSSPANAAQRNTNDSAWAMSPPPLQLPPADSLALASPAAASLMPSKSPTRKDLSATGGGLFSLPVGRPSASASARPSAFGSESVVSAPRPYPTQPKATPPSTTPIDRVTSEDKKRKDPIIPHNRHASVIPGEAKILLGKALNLDRHDSLPEISGSAESPSSDEMQSLTYDDPRDVVVDDSHRRIILEIAAPSLTTGTDIEEKSVPLTNDTLPVLKYISPSVREVLGLDPILLLTRPISDFVHSEDVPILLRAINDLAFSDEATSIEMTFRCKQVKPVFFPSGSVPQFQDRWAVMEGKGMRAVGKGPNAPLQTVWVMHVVDADVVTQSIGSPSSSMNLEYFSNAGDSYDGRQEPPSSLPGIGIGYKPEMSGPRRLQLERPGTVAQPMDLRSSDDRPLSTSEPQPPGFSQFYGLQRVLCHICENPVPVHKFEEHHQTCALAHRVGMDLQICHEELKEVKESVTVVVDSLRVRKVTLLEAQRTGKSDQDATAEGLALSRTDIDMLTDLAEALLQLINAALSVKVPAVELDNINNEVEIQYVESGSSAASTPCLTPVATPSASQSFRMSSVLHLPADFLPSAVVGSRMTSAKDQPQSAHSSNTPEAPSIHSVDSPLSLDTSLTGPRIVPPGDHDANAKIVIKVPAIIRDFRLPSAEDFPVAEKGMHQLGVEILELVAMKVDNARKVLDAAKAQGRMWLNEKQVWDHMEARSAILPPGHGSSFTSADLVSHRLATEGGNLGRSSAYDPFDRPFAATLMQNRVSMGESEKRDSWRSTSSSSEILSARTTDLDSPGAEGGFFRRNSKRKSVAPPKIVIQQRKGYASPVLNPSAKAPSKLSHPPLSPLLVSSPSSSQSHQPLINAPGIKDFDIVKPISKGAFGSVYLARKKVTGNYYAIKVLRKSDMVAKNQVTNVKAERMILMMQTNSPYVSNLFYSFQSKNYLYLVMEYLPGGDCAALLKNLEVIPEEWSVKYLAEMICGVDFLHSKGITHRDLKPDNFLIDAKGHLKLTDFGLSKMGFLGRRARDETAMLSRSAAVGSPRAFDSPPGAVPLSSMRGRSPPQTPESSFRPLRSIRRESVVLSNFFLMNHSRRGSLAQSQNDPGAMRGPDYSLSAASPIPRSPSMRSIDPDSFNRSLRTSRPGSASLMDFNSEQERRFVGTPDYLAPETVLGSDGDDSAVDWWALGAILYEFLFGIPPFHASTPTKVFENILSCNVDYHYDDDTISAEARDLIKSLLQLDPSKRLGFHGVEEVKQHPFFHDLNWDTLLDEDGPFIPQPSNMEDTMYFEDRGATMDILMEKDSDNDDVESVKGFTTRRKIPPANDGAPQPAQAMTAHGASRHLSNPQPRPPSTSIGQLPLTDLSKSASKAVSTPQPIPSPAVPPPSRLSESKSAHGTPVLSSTNSMNMPHRKSVPSSPFQLMDQQHEDDDFGSFVFKNLPALEKANIDTVMRLRSESRQMKEGSSGSPVSGDGPPSKAGSVISDDIDIPTISGGTPKMHSRLSGGFDPLQRMHSPYVMSPGSISGSSSPSNPYFQQVQNAATAPKGSPPLSLSTFVAEFKSDSSPAAPGPASTSTLQHALKAISQNQGSRLSQSGSGTATGRSSVGPPESTKTQPKDIPTSKNNKLQLGRYIRRNSLPSSLNDGFPELRGSVSGSQKPSNSGHGTPVSEHSTTSESGSVRKKQDWARTPTSDKRQSAHVPSSGRWSSAGMRQPPLPGRSSPASSLAGVPMTVMHSSDERASAPPPASSDIGAGTPPSIAASTFGPGHSTSGKSRTLLILVADDNPVFCRVVEYYLSKYGYHFVTVYDGAEVIRCATGTVRFDIIFLDAAIPIVDSDNVARMVRSTSNVNQATPIIEVIAQNVATAQPSKYFDERILKPLNPDMLLDKVRCVATAGRGEKCSPRTQV